MQYGHHVAAFVAAMAVVGSSAAAMSPQAGDWVLGTHSCRHAIFMKLSVPLVITFDAIAYAETWALDSYRQQVQVGTAEPTVATVRVNAAKWTGNCDSLEYTVEAGGEIRTSLSAAAFAKATLDGHIAFTAGANNQTSVAFGPFFVGVSPTDLKSELMYDSMGRRQVARTLFSLGEKAYEVTFSGYAYDAPGRLVAYRVEIREATQ
jgi:hypothetical protein